MTETDSPDTTGYGPTKVTVRALGAGLDLDARRVLRVQVEPAELVSEIKFKATTSARQPREAPHLLPTAPLGGGRLEVRLPDLSPGSTLTITIRRKRTTPLDLTPIVADAESAGLDVTDGPAGRLTLTADPAPPISLARRLYWRVPPPRRVAVRSRYERLRVRIAGTTTRTEYDG